MRADRRKFDLVCMACDYRAWFDSEGIALAAAEMHEMLGPTHKCQMQERWLSDQPKPDNRPEVKHG